MKRKKKGYRRVIETVKTYPEMEFHCECVVAVALKTAKDLESAPCIYLISGIGNWNNLPNYLLPQLL